MRPGVRTGQTHLPQKDRHHRHGTRRFFAVGLALRAPPLRHKERLRLRHFAGEIADHVHGNSGDLRRPFRGLRRLVFAVPQDVALVVAVFGCGRGKRLRVVTHAVLVKKRLIHPVMGNEFVGQSTDQRSVGTGADRNPLIGARRGRIRKARIDHDDARTLFRESRIDLKTLTAARRTRHRGIVPKEHIEFGIRDLRRQRRGTAAVSHREGGRTLGV